jgi:DNA-binding SARP family transcriptional activator
MRFALLGPLIVLDDAGARIQLSGPRLRVLLAALLLHANAPISAEVLTEAVWDEAPSSTATDTLRSYVRRLRRALGPLGADRIETRDPGYLVRVEQGELDTFEFEASCLDASAALQAGSYLDASKAAARALGLWRGEPLLDVPSRVLCDEFAPRFEALRLQAFENQAEAGLRLGHYDRLIPELNTLAAAHPLRERFHAQLIRALAQSGRRAEALDAYQSARTTLARELGIEPGPELRELQARILAGQPISAHTAAATQAAVAQRLPRGAGSDTDNAPMQLPAGIPHFVGRSAALAELSRLAAIAAEQPVSPTIAISAIDGLAGVGKTALAVHFAAAAAGRFPDGLLYVNLRGFDPGGEPLDPAQVLRGFLETLGMPVSRIPSGLEARIGAYRSRLTGRRMLIVLDNARDSDQVRALLPGTAGCLVLITSRDQLAGLIALEGAHPLTVDVFTLEEAHELLTRRLGAERVAREPGAVAELSEQCARLPLALNIAAARAALKPTHPLEQLVEEQRDSAIAALDTGDAFASVRAVFWASYRTLDAAAARMFRLLAEHPGSDISVNVAASLAGTSRDQARGALRELTRGQLLTESAPGRYTCHDLLRAYAAELSQSLDEAPERRRAAERVLDHYLHTAQTLNRTLYPAWHALELPEPAHGVMQERLEDREHAQRWFAAEYRALVSATARASVLGFDDHAWRLAWVLVTILERQGYWREWHRVSEIALGASRRTEDLPGQAHAHSWLGAALAALGEHAEARVQFGQAAALFERLGDHTRRGIVHTNICRALEREDRYGAALEHAQEALECFREVDHVLGQASALNNIGWYQANLGRNEQGLDHCLLALELVRASGDPYGEAGTLDTIGSIQHRLGRHAACLESFEHALLIQRKAGEKALEALTLTHLGDACYDVHDTDAAREAWSSALEILTQLEHLDAREVRAKLRQLTLPD